MEHIYSSNSAQYHFFAESLNQNRRAAKRHQDRKKREIIKVYNIRFVFRANEFH